jgi:hypothetical protein
VIGYLVEKLRNRDLLFKENTEIKVLGKRVNGSVGLRLAGNKKESKRL